MYRSPASKSREKFYHQNIYERDKGAAACTMSEKDVPIRDIRAVKYEKFGNFLET